MAEERQHDDTIESFIGEGGNGQGQRELETREDGGGYPEWTPEEWDLWNRNLWGRSRAAAGFSGAAQAGGLSSAVTAANESVGDSQLDVRDRTGQDPWMHYDPWQGSWRNPRAGAWWQPRGDDKNFGKGDYSDPPGWPGFQHYRLWKKAVSRWDAATDVKYWRRTEKILKSMDWELQSRFEHIPDEDLQGPQYLWHLFQVLDVLAGEREYTDMRRSVRAALYEGARRGDETLGQYSLRREAQFSTASKFLELPSQLKGFMLEEQAGLSRQAVHSLRVLTGGNSDYESVKKALRVLDIEEENMCKGKTSSSFMQEDEAAGSYFEVDNEEVDILDTDEVHELFFAIENMDLCEDRASNFAADWQKKKRSWGENRELKNAMKKDRRHFDDPSSRPLARDHGKGMGKRKRNIANLKLITRCANCGEKGHWRAECTRPYKAKQDHEKSSKNAFVYMGDSSKDSGHHFLSNFRATEDNFLTVPPGFAIVDPGAAQDLIGSKAFSSLQEKLASVGLKPVILDEKPPAASGIGGNASPIFTALTPVFLGGHPGLVKLVVLADDVPQLLSIGLLEHTHAIIDTSSNQIEFKKLGSSDQMTKLESGHRALDVVSHNGTRFVPLPGILEQYGLPDGAFEINSSAASCACLADSPPLDTPKVDPKSVGVRDDSNPKEAVVGDRLNHEGDPKEVVMGTGETLPCVFNSGLFSLFCLGFPR